MPTQTLEGTLVVVWADPRPGAQTVGETRYALATAGGKLIPLEVNGQANAALLNFGKHVTISGLSVASAPKTPGDPISETFVVNEIAGPPAAAAPAATGTKKVLYLLVKFSDDASVPHPPAFYTNLNNPDTPPAGETFPTTLNGFFKKTSDNQFSWIGEVGGIGGIGASGGWLTLPHTKAFYAPCDFSSSCADVYALADDATALARGQGINLAAYDNINFVLSNDLDCCAWGGGYFTSVENKSFGVTWEPPWGQETGTYAHELGHSLGLPHSGWVYYAYDSPWDTMSNRTSANSAQCGSYLSKNEGGVSTLYCSEPGDGYIAPHKDYLGWIPAANAVVSDTSSNASVTLEGSSLPLGAAIKMLKICIAGVPCSGSAAHYFTVEARVGGLGSTSRYDNGLAGEGVIIHDVHLSRPSISGACFFNSQSGWAVPIDSTPGDYDSVACNFGGRGYPNFALYNAQWNPGQTYTNLFSIKVVSRTGSSFVVSTTGFAPPVASSVVPAGGPPSGGTNFTITGTNFTAGSIVTLDGIAATNISFVNANTITGTSPAHAAGSVNVVVTNTLGQTSTLVNGYLYTNAPIITTQPLSQAVVNGASAALSVAASGASPLTYQWYVGNTGNTSSPIGGATSNTYNTPPLTTTTRYWVRVTNGSGFANSSTAKISISFTDSTLIVHATSVKRVHITELRTRIDALRLKYGGLAAYTYATDPTITAGSTRIKAQHIAELRAALEPAYVNATGTPATYVTDASLAAGVTIKAAHISELRNLVLSIE